MKMTIYWNKLTSIISHLDCTKVQGKTGKSLKDRGQMVPIALCAQNPILYCVDCCCLGVFVVKHAISTQTVDIVALRVDGDGDND